MIVAPPSTFRIAHIQLLVCNRQRKFQKGRILICLPQSDWLIILHKSGCQTKARAVTDYSLAPVLIPFDSRKAN